MTTTPDGKVTQQLSEKFAQSPVTQGGGLVGAAAPAQASASVAGDAPSMNLADLAVFTEGRYARNLVVKTDTMEVLVVCWQPGQETVMHGHGPTDGVVMVVEGEITNREVAPDGCETMKLCRKGDICHTPVGYRHQMMNLSKQKAVTLHFYAPPLGKQYLNPDLGYTNEVSLNEIQLPDQVVRILTASPQYLAAIRTARTQTQTHSLAPAHYLDNGATSWPKPEAVYQAMDTSFRGMFSPKRGTAKASRAGAERLTEARHLIASLINAPEAHRIGFTAGATHALNLAIQSFDWQPGDAVVMSAVEHHAVSRPIRKLAKERGVRFHVVPYTDDEPFDLTAFEALLQSDPDIRLVATTHASNVIGSVLPVAQIGALCQQYGKVYLLDAAQTAGVLPIDVQAMNLGMVALPGHKSLYGPPGVGALYVGPNVSLTSLMEGGTGGDSGVHEMPYEPPTNIEVGTIALPQILALAEGVKWVRETGIEAIHHHEMALLQQLLDGLKAMPQVTIYGHTDLSRKTPVVSFNVAGFSPKELGERLFDEYGIALRAGFHCAPMAHEAIGTVSQGGTVRASMGYFTKADDVDALLRALSELIA